MGRELKHSRSLMFKWNKVGVRTDLCVTPAVTGEKNECRCWSVIEIVENRNIPITWKERGKKRVYVKKSSMLLSAFVTTLQNYVKFIFIFLLTHI